MLDASPAATTLLARWPTLPTLANLEGYAAAHSAPTAELLAQFWPAGCGSVVADQYAYSLLDPASQKWLAAASLNLVDTSNAKAVGAALTAGNLLYTTTLQEPFLTVPDVPALAALAQERGATLLIDATLTPLLTDLYACSAALHRHSGLLLGQPDHRAVLLEGTNLLDGAVLPEEATLLKSAPTSAHLLSQLATLPARLRTHSGNAQAAADVLSGHPQVRAVYYPGLSTHPQFEPAGEQFPAGFSGLLGLQVRPHESFVAKLGQVWPQQAGYGTAYSTFSAYNNRLLQLWLGLEDISDLLTELEAALE